MRGDFSDPRVRNERFAQRDCERRARRRVLLTALSAMLVGVYSSNPLLVRRIALVGLETVPESTIRQQTDSLLGQHWPLARLRPLQRRLEKLPSLRRVQVIRWPAEVITVRVQERQPVLLLTTRSGVFAVDEEGMVFAPPEKLPLHCPSLTGGRFASAKPGTRLPAPDLRRILQGLDGARTAGLPPVTRLRVDRSGSLSVYVEGPYCIRVGRQDVSHKLALAKCTLDSLKQRGQPVASVDLRLLSAPTWSPHLS